MPRGGSRVGAGRPAGSGSKLKNARKVLETKAAELTDAGAVKPDIARMTPLEVMLHAMALEADAARWKDAAALAKEAAPYLHPKLSSETLRVQTDDSQRGEDDIRREIDEIRQRAAATTGKGTVAPTVPPEPPRVFN